VTSDDQLSRDLQSLRIDRGARPSPPAADVPPSPPHGPSTVARVAKVGALVGLLALGIVGFRALRDTTEARLFKTEVTFTEVGTLSPAQGSVEVTSTGYVVPQIVAKVGTRITGRISKVGVREGGPVKAGDILFELDASDQRSAVSASNARVLSASAKVNAARAQLHEVEIQLARQQELVRVGAAPKASSDDLAARTTTLKEQLKAQEVDVIAARADVSALAVGLAHTTVKAPIDGVAVTKPSELGDVVSPINTLVELVDFSTLLVETDVPEGRLGKIRPDGPCEVVLDALEGQRFRGKVLAIGPRLNRSKATAQVKVRFDAPPKELRPEMAVRVSFLSRPLDEAELRAAPKVIVPAKAVVDRESAKVVFVVEGDKVRAVPVELGEKSGSDFVLKSGPLVGTKLVENPLATLKDGQAVKEKTK